MANEGTISGSLAYSRAAAGIASISRSLASVSFNVSGTEYYLGVQSVSNVGAEALELGKVVNCGYIIVRNLDATNYVTLRNGVGGTDLVRIDPGEVALFRLATNTPFALANTAPVMIEYLLLSA